MDGDLDGLEVGLLVGRGEGAKLRDGINDGWDEGCPLLDGTADVEGRAEGCEEGWLDSLGNKLCDGLDEDWDDGCPLLDGTVDVDGFSDGEVVGLVVVGLEFGAFVGY